MKLWISGRIDYDIDDGFFRKVLHEVEQSVNAVIEKRDYGSSIESWDVIMIVFKDGMEGTFKYNARTKETDIEVPIDHEKFKAGHVRTGKILFFDALIISLQKLKEDRRIKDFSFQKIIDDVTAIAEKENGNSPI
ncbi:MAG: Imm44 family immunity protein [Chitinophagaceae bacterium]